MDVREYMTDSGESIEVLQAVGSMTMDRVVMLKANHMYHGHKFLPHSELEKAYHTFDKIPIFLNHDYMNVEQEVGHIEKVYMSGEYLVGKPVISHFPKSDLAMQYIQARIAHGIPPNVSCGFFRELTNDGSGKYTYRDITGHHLGIVTYGACSHKDGCGIGLQNNKTEADVRELLELQQQLGMKAKVEDIPKLSDLKTLQDKLLKR